MTYEYTVNIPDGKRRQFRSMVKKMGGTVVSPAREVADESLEPNEETVEALREVEAGVGLEPFDLKEFESYVATL